MGGGGEGRAVRTERKGMGEGDEGGEERGMWRRMILTREGHTVLEALAYCVPPFPGKAIKLLCFLHNAVSIFLFVAGA